MGKHSIPITIRGPEPETSRPAPGLLPAADLAAEVERLKGQLHEERERTVRALADFKNYRRRQESEVKTLAESGKREIILPLLEIVDDIERSLETAEKGGEPLAEGVKLIHRKLLALLEAQGIRPMKTKGVVFTPDLHEAVAVMRDKRHEPGTIVDELRKGYLWHDQLLRPAQVRVAE